MTASTSAAMPVPATAWRLHRVAPPVKTLRNGVDAAARLAPRSRPVDMGEYAYVASDAQPRMEIENRAYSNGVFDRMHVEVARRADETDVHREVSDEVDILHSVFIPRREIDVPILSLDVVSINGRVTMAIADPSPMDHRLPLSYRRGVENLQKVRGLASNRAMPEWGREIFSDLCVLTSPRTREELDNFVNYAINLAFFHVSWTSLHAPDPAKNTAYLDASRARYVAGHLKNDKTRRMLETAFGGEFADEYMRQVMFRF